MCRVPVALQDATGDEASARPARHFISPLKLGASCHPQGCARAQSALRRRSGGTTETLPGRKAETDRVFEGISEGFRPTESGRVAPGGAGASSPGTPYSPTRTNNPRSLQTLNV